VDLPGEGGMVLADTVGFISHLPHELVAAFKSTLQETSQATLLLHVIDAASHQRAVCVSEVNDVLSQIGANEIPQIEVYNKIDLMEDEPVRIERGEDGLVTRVWLSARNGEGLEQLLQALAEFFHQEHVHKVIQLSPAEGRLRAKLFEAGKILSEQITDEGGWEIEVQMPRREFDRLMVQESDLEKRLIA
jgi:GTP-binding protein HflX